VKQVMTAAPWAQHRAEDVAAAVGVSQFHLARVFRAETGTSLHQYLLRIRMERALTRLGEGERQLSRLALELGFSSHSHFSAVFRRHFGESPARARAAMRSTFEHPAQRARGSEQCALVEPAEPEQKPLSSRGREVARGERHGSEPFRLHPSDDGCVMSAVRQQRRHVQTGIGVHHR